MSNQTNTTESTVSTLGLLGIAFVVLKLTKVISCTWWLVTAPFWGPFGILLVVLSVALIFRTIRFLITGK